MRLIIRPRIPRPPVITVRYRYRSLAEFSSDELKAFTQYELIWQGEELRLTTSIHMPDWQHKCEVSRSESDEWLRFWAALLFHEKGHVAICREHARYLFKQMECTRDQDRAALFEKERRRLETLHAQYDLRTQHGLIQDTPYGPIRLLNPGEYAGVKDKEGQFNPFI